MTAGFVGELQLPCYPVMPGHSMLTAMHIHLLFVYCACDDFPAQLPCDIVHDGQVTLACKRRWYRPCYTLFYDLDAAHCPTKKSKTTSLFHSSASKHSKLSAAAGEVHRGCKCPDTAAHQGSKGGWWHPLRGDGAGCASGTWRSQPAA